MTKKNAKSHRFLERFIFPVAVLAGALSMVYWYWTTTPSYAINEIVDSLNHHDSQLFEKYVDIDSLASHAFDDVLEGPGKDIVLSQTNNLIGVGFLRFFKKDIVGVAHERLCGAISDPSISLDSVSDGTLDSMRRYHISNHVRQALVDYGLTKRDFKGIKYLNVNGNYALLGLDFYSPMLNSDYIVEFRLEDAGGFWRVTELTNLNQLMSVYLQTRSRIARVSWPPR